MGRARMVRRRSPGRQKAPDDARQSAGTVRRGSTPAPGRPLRTDRSSWPASRGAAASRPAFGGRAAVGRWRPERGAGMKPGLAPLHRIHARPGSEPLRGPVWTQSAGGPVYPALARCRTLGTSPELKRHPGRPLGSDPGPQAREGQRARVGRRSGSRARLELHQGGRAQLRLPGFVTARQHGALTTSGCAHNYPRWRGEKTGTKARARIDAFRRIGVGSVCAPNCSGPLDIRPALTGAAARPDQGRRAARPLRPLRALPRHHRHADGARRPHQRCGGAAIAAGGVARDHQAATSSRSGRPIRSGQVAPSGQFADSQRTALSYRRTCMSFPSWRAASFFESPNTRHETVTRSQPVTRSYSSVRARS